MINFKKQINKRSLAVTAFGIVLMILGLVVLWASLRAIYNYQYAIGFFGIMISFIIASVGFVLAIDGTWRGSKESLLDFVSAIFYGLR